VRGRSSTLSVSEEGAFHGKISRWSSVYKDSSDARLKETTYLRWFFTHENAMAVLHHTKPSTRS